MNSLISRDTCLILVWIKNIMKINIKKKDFEFKMKDKAFININ
jgi:hypothetical protein